MPVFHHVPVLFEEVVETLSGACPSESSRVFVDCTLGGGGHSEGLLQRTDARVVGIDRDPSALAAASKRLSRFGDRFVAVRASFDALPEVLRGQGLSCVHGVLADLGVSSHQLDTAERGFSFQRSGPVDMRMDPDAPLSAADIVNGWDEEDIANVIYRYGEERASRRIARAIVEGRPWTDSLRLAEVISAAVGGRKGRTHPATRTFQGLRIAVNDELGQVERLLPSAVDVLAPGGRIAVITFHSLEDRLVKQAFSKEAGKNAPRDPWGNVLGPVRLRLLKPLTPSDDPNPRARSARLRSAERTPWNAP